MNQFHWKGSQPNSKGGAAVNTVTAASISDIAGVKIQPNQSYQGQIKVANVPLPTQTKATQTSAAQTNTAQSNTAKSNSTTGNNNQTGKAAPQIQISIPQANGQSVTVSQPLAQMPHGFNANQQIQVLLNITKTGDMTITLVPDKQSQAVTNFTSSSTSNSTSSPAQNIKLNLSNSQIVNLLTLNKAFKLVTANGQTTQIQTTAQIVEGKNQLPQLKLPASPTPIKLPDNIASLLQGKEQGQKSVTVTLTPKGRDIELQIELPKSASAKTPNNSQGNTLSTTITAEKLNPIIKQALNQASNQQIVISKQPSGDKITLSNQQEFNLGGKVATLQQGEGQLKLTQLSGGQLNVEVQNKTGGQMANVKLTIAENQINTTIKQALKQSINQGPSQGLSQGLNQVSIEGKNLSNSKEIQAPIAAPNVNPTSNPDLQIQKQALQQFIDPLVRLLLPKKLNWSEGFKALAALEQTIKPDAKTQVGQNLQVQGQQTQQVQNQQTANQTNIDLKQLINQITQTIPDHTSNLDDKTITNMVSEILNFSPTKTTTASVQSTPANAIANALQLLLGAKLTQGEGKLTNQLQQQLQQLIKPMAPKAPATEAGVKNAMQSLANLEQANGSLKALTGIQSAMRHQQVENIEKRLDGNTQLEFNFPLRVDNQVKELHIAINEEKHKSETSSARLSIWNLNLTFDLNALGKLLVNTKLKDGEISMHMYAEQPKTLALMNKFSATLEERLEFHGVKINNIQSSLGKISSTNTKRQLNSLVQIKV